MNRKLKIGLGLISGIILFVAVALWLLNYWLQTDDAARTIEQLLSEKLAARVEIETPMTIMLVPEFAVQVQGLKVMDNTSEVKPVVQAGNSLLRLDSRALLERRLNIGQLESQNIRLRWRGLQTIWSQAPGRRPGQNQRPLALQSLGHISGQSIRIVDFATPGISLDLQRAELWPPADDDMIPLELIGKINSSATTSLDFFLRLEFSIPNGSTRWGSQIRVEQFRLSEGIPGWGQPVSGSMQLQWLAKAIAVSEAEIILGPGIYMTISEGQIELNESNTWHGAINLRISEDLPGQPLSILCDASGDRDSARLINCHSPGGEGLFSGSLVGCRGPAGRWTVSAEFSDLDLARIRVLSHKLPGPSDSELFTVEALGILPFAGIIRIASLRDGDWLGENVVISLPGDHSCQIGGFD